ncbi:MAG: cation transporter, partial [Pseudomonadales bacterium]|nr:cation transporter [Pseudomonadales bacterium]
KKTHKASVSETFLVKRHLKLEGEGDIPWDQIEKEIDQLMGIDEVHLEKEKHTITVAYDASYKSLQDIEQVLDEHFIHTAADWWTRTKKSWYEYTDDNIKDNIKHEAWSCHSKGGSNKRK